MVKIEFGGVVDLVASPVGKDGKSSDYEKGSATWLVAATAPDGSDASGDYTLEADADNELKATLTHSGTSESTALITLRADGDDDADETAEVVGTADIIVDKPNTVAFEMTATPR